jgi:hypothetical protein
MRFYELPFYLRRVDYCGMPAVARAVFHGLIELLEDQEPIFTDYRTLANWLSLSITDIRRGLKAIIECEILEVEQNGVLLKINYPGHKSKAAKK